MSISLPVELYVKGCPVSHQSDNRSKLRGWRDSVREQAQARVSGAPVGEKNDLEIGIQFFYTGVVPVIDTDNLAKPIQDALEGVIYSDDRQILEQETQH